MAQVSPAPPDHPQSTSHPFTGWVITCGLCPACKGRRAWGSLRGLRVERGEPAIMQEKQGGLAGRHVQRACCPFWSRGRRHMGEGGGGDERSRGQGRGKYCLPSSTPPFLLGSAWSSSCARRTSGDFPSPSFHLSVHSPRRSSCALLQACPVLPGSRVTGWDTGPGRLFTLRKT